ncbi:MAG: hypothetical protein PVSMB4_15750 [Ktedonobacterales bacterium]
MSHDALRRGMPLACSPWPLALLASVVLVVSAAQAFGNFNLDIYEYQCYAVAFWRGSGALSSLPAGQCDLMSAVAGPALASHPLRTLPREYGGLALAVFSLPLLAPAPWYPWLFAAEMSLVVLATAFVCAREGPRLAGHAYLLYVLVGSMLLAAARFDVFPALLTLLALVWAQRGRQAPAYVALAAATLVKLYPVVLLLPFLIHDLRQSGQPRAHRLRGLAIYVGVIALDVGISLGMSPTAALAPVGFLMQRGIEIESVPAALLLIAHVGLGVPLDSTIVVNVTTLVSPLAGAAAVAGMVLTLGLVVASAWRQWRRRLSLREACLVTVLAVLAGSKVLSPQYLLWVAPLVAVVYGMHLPRCLGWCVVCLLTTLAFPIAYDGSLSWLRVPSPLLELWLSAARNAVLVLFTLAALRGHGRPRERSDADASAVGEVVVVGRNVVRP